MSNRLTFSLASLVLIFAMAFVAMPAIAADGGPTVTLAEYTGVEDPAAATAGQDMHTQARGDFRVLLTFSHSVAAPISTDVMYRSKGADGRFGSATAIDANPVAVLNSGGKKYVATLPAAAITDATTQVNVSIADDAVSGDTTNLLGIVGNSMTFTLPPLNVGTVMLAAPKAVAGTPGSYTIVATFDSKADPAATHTLSPAFAASYIDIMPEGAADPPTIGNVDTSTDNKAVVTITVQLKFGTTEARVSIDPGYVAGSNTITLPPAAPVAVVPPTATLSVPADEHDTNAKTFKVVLTLSKDHSEDLDVDDLKITDASTPAATLSFEDDDIVQQRATKRMYTAILKYGPLDTLPLTVTTAESLTLTGDAPTAMVVAPRVPTAPGAPTNVTAVVNQATDTITVSWAAPADNGGSPIIGYRVNVAGDAGYRFNDPRRTSASFIRSPGTYSFTVQAINGIGYSVVSESVSATITPEPVTLNPPAARIAVSNLNVDTRTFEVAVSLTPAPKSDGSAGDDVTTFDSTYLDVMDGHEDVGITASAERKAANSYRAILKYDELATLPLTVTVDQDHLETSNPNHSATVEVVVIEPTNNPPMFASETATRSIAEDTAAGMDIGDPVTATDEDTDDTLTYTLGGTDMASFAIVATSGQLQTKAALDYETKTSYEVTVTASDGTDSDSITVTISVTDVDEPPITGPDRIPPTFTHNAPPTPITSATTVTLTFSEPVSGVTVTGDLTSDNAKYTITEPEGSTNIYTVMITPFSRDVLAADVGLKVVRFTVTGADAVGNTVAEGSGFSVTLAPRKTAPPDTTAPVLTSNQTTATTGVVTVMLTFDEALSAAPTVTHAAMPAGLAGTYTVSAVTGTASPYTVTVTPSAATTANIPAGTVTLTVSAMDESGNAITTGNTVAVMLAARAAKRVKATATFTGTLSLTEQSIITVTLSKAEMLKEADFEITGGEFAGLQAKADAAIANTVWRLAINPDADPFTDSITVTIAASSKVAKPAATHGSLTTAEPKATLSSIETAAGANDTAAFVVSFAFTTMLPDGVSLMKTDIKVTPTTAKKGTPGLSPSDTKVWQVLITPTMGMDTKIELSDAGKMKFAYTGSALTVMKKATRSAVGTITATPSADGMTVTLSGRIASNGFAVVGAAVLRDLEEFFDIGGTIGLNDADSADGNDKNSREVVISEILWGLDFGATAINHQKQWQFIELYNTTNAEITLDNWTLKFTEGRPVPKSDVDQVSNRDGAGWIVREIGQSGRVTNTRATDPEATVTAINIVSMYRNINYDKVEKVKADGSADPNRDEQLKGIPGGNGKGSWKASTRRDPNTPNGAGITGANAARWIYSTRGAKHYTTTAILTASAVSGSPFRINEIGNDTGSENDWVELHNVSDAEAPLKNWALSKVTAKGTDTKILDFKDQDWKVPAKGFVVISTRHPKDTDLAAGKDISVADDQEENKGVSSLFVVKPVDLPDDGKFALILRNAHDKQGGDGHLVDVVATRQGAFADRAIGTSLWPLKATGLPHENVIDGGDENFAAGKVYQRNSGNGRGDKQFAVRGYTGVGYDRDALAVAANGGTPGYENGAVKDKIAGLTTGDITISEVMVDTGAGRQNLPQWIELYNSSMTQAVSLAGWKLRLENASPDPNLNTFNATLSLDGMTISPNQTVLIVTTTGRNSDPDHFPSTRLVNIWTTKKHREALEMTRRTDQVISMKGFNLTLLDKDNVTVDAAGNLDGVRRTRDEPAWALPTSEDDGRRSSLIRRYDDGVAVPGMMKEAWVSADKTNFAFTISETYYGNPDDFGTPGFRGGGPLPVSLSKFRPERMKDTGEVVVRWITESELNNAGFNILRSDKRDGEFTKVHYVAGQGTTSERSVYEWKDTSAKPNVVYYYQIQDVSLDGEVTTLRTTHLRGNVTSVGKATTTWGEIKALQ